MLKWIMFLACTACAANGDLDRQWKARALQGIERADSLAKLIPKDEKKRKYSVIPYQFAVEMAFASFIHPELGKIARKRTSTVIAYHFMMKIGERENDDLLDIAFLYDPKTEDFLGVRIDRLPYPWCLRPDFGEKAPNILSVNNVNDVNQPAIFFNKRDPFDVVVMGE
jgi:hypothetical protein